MKELSHMYSVQNSPSKEMLFLHIAQFYFMLISCLYEDVRLFCSIQYSLLSDMTTFLFNIADIPGCILCK